MAISIEHLNDYNTYDEYSVRFFDDYVFTTVTASPSVVDTWISETESLHRYRLNRLVVGLDAEWRPNFGRYNNPVATLQLCVGHRCLIFQILHAPYVPDSLEEFLGDGDYTFVGVGVEKDAEMLEEDYELTVERCVDLRGLAAERLENWDLRSAGLKSLAREVLNVEMEKPRAVTLSRWDHRWLSHDQVQYACCDAYACFEIGRILRAFTV